MYVLRRESLVVHKQKVDISGVVHNKSFVPGGHQMPGFLIGTVSDLNHGTLISLNLKQHKLPTRVSA